MNIRKKTILILLICTIIPMGFVCMLGYFQARRALESQRMEELKIIADLRAKRIEDFFDNQKKNIIIARKRPTIVQYCSMLKAYSGDFSSPFYKTVRDELDRALTLYIPVYKFTNVFIANPEGRIVYALDRSSPQELLGKAIPDQWKKAIVETENIIRLSDIVASKKEKDQFAISYLVSISSNESQFVGMAVFETDLSPIYELIQNTTGLGETGETLIAKKYGNHVLFLNPLRHDPDAALKRRVVFGERQAIPVQEAVIGKNGSGISVDYRGQEVISVWRHLPDLDWGLVVKMDVSEAFRTVTTLRDFILLLVIAVIILSIFAALVVAKSISDPIQTLQRGVEEIGKGHLDHKVATKAKDEIGQLGRAFDQMTEQLRSVTVSRDELDREIKERIEVGRKLQININKASERIKKLNCFFGISRLVENRELNLNELIQGIVELIPSAMRYPETTCAKIALKGQEFRTDNFEETEWSINRHIAVGGKTVGFLDVYCLAKIPEGNVGPFLKEEKDLVDAIAERVGRIVERKKSQKALLESENRFRDLVEHSITGISIIQDGQIVYQNPEQEKLLGPLPRPIIFADADSIHPDDVEKVNRYYQAMRKKNFQDSPIDFKFCMSGKNVKQDRMKWVQCQTNRIKFQGKDALLLNIMDITKTKELEQLLTRQDKMASLGRVAAGIAHEIRNPLSGINIYLNTLKNYFRKGGNEEKVEEIMKQIQSASIKIESVIRRVMDFAKPSEPEMNLIDMNIPISEAISLTAVSLRKSGIEISTSLENNLPLIYADKHMMEEVFLNLLNNAAEAMKAMESDQKVIITSFAEDDHIIIEISDSGPGVPKKIQNEIFDPYFTTKHEGTGIGLSFCYRIITDHGGSLTVSDSHLGGATFHIDIPVKDKKTETS